MEDKIKSRHNLTLELSENASNKFSRIKNKSRLVSQLIENHYKSDDCISFNIDDRIRDAYENDIYRDIRPQMLLLEFYSGIRPNGVGIELSEVSLTLNDQRNDLLKSKSEDAVINDKQVTHKNLEEKEQEENEFFEESNEEFHLSDNMKSDHVETVTEEIVKDHNRNTHIIKDCNLDHNEENKKKEPLDIDMTGDLTSIFKKTNSNMNIL